MNLGTPLDEEVAWGVEDERVVGEFFEGGRGRDGEEGAVEGQGEVAILRLDRIVHGNQLRVRGEERSDEWKVVCYMGRRFVRGRGAKRGAKRRAEGSSLEERRYIWVVLYLFSHICLAVASLEICYAPTVALLQPAHLGSIWEGGLNLHLMEDATDTRKNLVAPKHSPSGGHQIGNRTIAITSLLHDNISDQSSSLDVVESNTTG